MARHGGGAFSGKDPSKVDRSAAYAARWVAKHVVAVRRGRGAARSRSPTPSAWPTRSRSWSRPSAPRRSTRPRSQRPCDELFDLRPAAIIRDLDLRRPIYRGTAAYGHFGRGEKEFTWEATAEGRRHEAGARALDPRSPARCDAGRPRPARRRRRSGRPFDYQVPPDWDDAVTVGTRVRVPLHGRRVGGWVVEDDVEPEPGLDIEADWPSSPGSGRPPRCSRSRPWAAWRWAGPLERTADGGLAGPGGPGTAGGPVPGPRPGSPRRTRSAGPPPRRCATSTARRSCGSRPRPTCSAVVEAAARRRRTGPVLVLVPNVGWAERLRGRAGPAGAVRLRDRGRRRRPAGRSWWARGAPPSRRPGPARGRGGPRRARPGLPGGAGTALRRLGRGGRAGPPGRRAVPPHLRHPERGAGATTSGSSSRRETSNGPAGRCCR